jgi:hypothetical protein
LRRSPITCYPCGYPIRVDSARPTHVSSVFRNRPMRHIVLATGLCGIVFAGLSNRAEGQPNQKDDLAPYRQAGLIGGNPARGRAVFESDKAGCTKCHVLRGDERRAGPDLGVIGDKFEREELVRAVLEPSARIHPDYGTIVATTTDGKVHTGVLRKRTRERDPRVEPLSKLGLSGPSGDLGIGFSHAVALQLRPKHGRLVGRRRRPGFVREGHDRPSRRKPRLECL